MRIYTVYTKPGEPEPVLIKEGFSWPAVAFTVFWALWHRLWWLAGGMLAAMVATSVALGALLGASEAHSAVNFGVVAIIGFVANDLHRRALEAKGWVLQEVVAAADADAAHHRYLEQGVEQSPS